ncbi:MAG: electron transfer flavoprotein subunit alpha/FixB family protein [Alphaproteobacteria bacterium]
MSGILLVADHANGKLADISAEMVGAAALVKDGIGGPLTVVVIARSPGDFTAALNLPGVDEIVTVETPGEHFDPAITEEAVCQIAMTMQPRLFLAGNTVIGMAYAAAVAARLGSGFASDCISLAVEEGAIVATRSGYGAKVNMDLAFPGRPVVTLTLRGATFIAPEGAGQATVSAAAVDLSQVAGMIEHVDYTEAPPANVDIEKAEFILSIGRGIGDEKAVPRFQALADKLGATLGCSRPVADSGWLPKPHQVGQSGKVASNCKLYVALGISGAVQHLFGMKHIDTVIAVNTDADAPIFSVAKYGATVDLFELADALERQFN